MEENNSCYSSVPSAKDVEYEVIRIEKTRAVCSVCENYANEQASKPIALMCCDGACLRGEVARRAADTVAYTLLPESTVRICLGGAFTKDTGQRGLVRNAERVVAIEGCSIKCASRMMQGVLPDLHAETIVTDGMFEFDKNLFGVNQMSAEDISIHAHNVAEKIVEIFRLKTTD